MIRKKTQSSYTTKKSGKKRDVTGSFVKESNVSGYIKTKSLES